jgi:hypothetical protein
MAVMVNWTVGLVAVFGMVFSSRRQAAPSRVV